MQLEVNQISRDWTILHNGRKFYVNYTESDFPFNVTQKNNRYYLKSSRSPLPNFSRVSAKVDFTSQTEDDFACLLVNKISREITIDTNGHISFSELLLVKSQTTFTVNSIRLQLPKDCDDVSAFDEQGKKLTAVLFENAAHSP